MAITSWTRAAATALLLAVAAPAAAQEELGAWVDPTFGKLPRRADYRITLFEDRAVEGQGTDLGLRQHNVTLAGPLRFDATDEWSASARGRFQEYDTRARFPETDERFPDELWEVRFGGSYRHRFENNWIGGASLTVGSASDKPFVSTEEMFLQAFGLLRVPHGERNAWLFSVYYATDEEYLSGLPIPGIAYFWSPSDQFRAVIGLPFSSVEYSPVEPLTFEASYFPPRRVRTRVTYRPFRPLRLYTGFDWDHDRYFLVDRGDEDDRLYYYEKRVTAGGRFDLQHVGIEVYGGYAFDRFYFVGEGYSDRTENRLDIDAGPFVAIRVSVRF